MKQTQTSFTLSAKVPAPGTRSSQINRVFSAALGVFLGEGDGARYERLYARYMGIAPLFRPDGRASEPWVPVEDMDASMQAVLHRGALRFGFVSGAPYVYRHEGELIGFDHELGSALVEIISGHYHQGDTGKLRAEWVEVTLASEEQADKLAILYRGLVDGDFDLALSGQMVLPDDNIPAGVHPEWTAPTALLFTAISYTGRDRDKLDLKKLAALRSTDLETFTGYAVAESVRLALELRIFSVNNPGPSPPAAQNLVINIHRAGGRAVWDTGDIASSNEVMLEATDHFAVGDSLASGAQSLLQGFDGIYLNIPANTEIWPIAGFTAAKETT